MTFVTANGVRLHVQRLPGDGPPLVFVHGLIDTLACYYFTLAGPVHDLGFDVVTYDLRGHGRSDRPPTGYTLDDAVDDLHAMIAGLGLSGPVHLVGYSFGGTVLFRYAHRHPSSVASLAVIESEPPTAAWAARTVDGLREVALHVGDPARMAVQPELVQKMSATARSLADTTTVTTDIVAPSGLMTADQVAALDVPMLLIVGGRSELHGHLSTVLPMLRRCTVEVIADNDHLLLITAPDQVCAALVPWLAARSAVAVA
jgi:pimeloyl-ACP methyl ester carboxylesterase